MTNACEYSDIHSLLLNRGFVDSSNSWVIQPSQDFVDHFTDPESHLVNKSTPMRLLTNTYVTLYKIITKVAAQPVLKKLPFDRLQKSYYNKDIFHASFEFKKILSDHQVIRDRLNPSALAGRLANIAGLTEDARLNNTLRAIQQEIFKSPNVDLKLSIHIMHLLLIEGIGGNDYKTALNAINPLYRRFVASGPWSRDKDIYEVSFLITLSFFWNILFEDSNVC